MNLVLVRLHFPVAGGLDEPSDDQFSRGSFHDAAVPASNELCITSMYYVFQIRRYGVGVQQLERTSKHVSQPSVSGVHNNVLEIQT